MIIFLNCHLCYCDLPLGLEYLLNQGIIVDETLADGKRISVELIIRDIIFLPEGVEVDIEVNDLNFEGNSYNLRLSRGKRHDITPYCTLHLPKYPPINPNPNSKRVYLLMYAPRCVEFSIRKMHPL